MAAFTLSPLFANFKLRDKRGRPVTVQAADLIGRKFNRLLAVAHLGGERTKTPSDRCKYLWLCDCGNFSIAQGNRVKVGTTKSCGCWKIKELQLRATHGATQGYTQGGKKWPEYGVWATMKARCNNPKNLSYSAYGGRGIKVHEEFDTFEKFIAHMGRSNGLTLERFDVDDDYAPGNVGWVPREVQNQNKRNSVWVSYKGEKLNLEKAIRVANKKRDAYYVFRKKGLSVQESFDLS